MVVHGAAGKTLDRLRLCPWPTALAGPTATIAMCNKKFFAGNSNHLLSKTPIHPLLKPRTRYEVRCAAWASRRRARSQTLKIQTAAEINIHGAERSGPRADVQQILFEILDLWASNKDWVEDLNPIPKELKGSQYEEDAVEQSKIWGAEDVVVQYAGRDYLLPANKSSDQEVRLLANNKGPCHCPAIFSLTSSLRLWVLEVEYQNQSWEEMPHLVAQLGRPILPSIFCCKSLFSVRHHTFLLQIAVRLKACRNCRSGASGNFWSCDLMVLEFLTVSSVFSVILYSIQLWFFLAVEAV